MSSPNLPPLSRTRSHRSIFREDFDSQHAPSFDADPRDMAPSPTPRDIRRLASDHDFVFGAHPTPRRLGWWPFVATHLSLPAALGAGVIFVVVAIAYTAQLTRQVLACPAWATECRQADAWTVENLGTVQGVIAMVYLIGMFALAHAALGLCETTVWPLLHKQPFTIRGLNAFLSTTRGSVMSAPAAVTSVKTPAAGFVLASALVVSLLPFAGPPLVGHAYSPAWRAVQLESNYTPGAGIAELYAQTNPPTSVLVKVLAGYNAWAAEPSAEPMPAYRDWYVDREALGARGDLAARAVRLTTRIACRPHHVQQHIRNELWWNAFRTNMTRAGSGSAHPGAGNSSAEVWVRPQPQLTLWADRFEFVSERRTRTTLVFAALNGTIEGGAVTPLALASVTNASAVACAVDVEAADDVLSVGSAAAEDDSALPVLSSLDTLTLSPAAAAHTRLNELLLWFTVAPLLAGPSVDGTQPMFANSTATGLPLAHTASSAPSPNTWTVPGLERFIRLSIGALAQATARNSATAPPPSSGSPPPRTLLTPRQQPQPQPQPTHTPIPLTTTHTTLTLHPSRALLLLLPPLLTLALTLTLAIYTTRTHARQSIPVLRQAGVGEVLKSSQTRWARDAAGADAAKTYLPHELGPVAVRYAVDAEGIAGFVAGDGAQGVGRFKGGVGTGNGAKDHVAGGSGSGSGSGVQAGGEVRGAGGTGRARGAEAV